ncbi:large-conductance mechanosensitive channel [Labrys miyagiensis]|uniref:Large-conductance mechanosensitive channel n=1 Tax=Labrys miyagiensis TaxID=346912 RepID=A0ABQ6CTY2_9HYPH|nr:MscL family protein [Labrys miyagiensis]GLS23807.1 large-conductance mechanosensitive channel [Labrys miyagiensis]
MLKELREISSRAGIAGLAISVAIGVTLGTVIGSAFVRLVTAIISDLLFPIIGAAIPGGLDFSNTYIMLRGSAPAGTSLSEARKLGPVLAIGDLISTFLYLAILMVVLFAAIKFLIKITRVFLGPAVRAPPADVRLLEEIRDLLAKKDA